MVSLLSILLSITFFIFMLKKSNVVLNVLQINSYENMKTIGMINERKTAKEKINDYVLLMPIVLLFLTIFVPCKLIIILLVQVLSLSLIIINTVKTNKKIKENKKKPLVFTDRIKRIQTVNVVILLVLLLVTILAYLFSNKDLLLNMNIKSFISTFNMDGVLGIILALSMQLIIFTLVTIFSSHLVCLSNKICLPIEKKINDKFYKEAQDILRNMKTLKVVGVTGSYGKTSTKYILDGILSSKFNVCKTPGSYNTLLGVIRTIREKLMPTDEVFIVEMGARHINDIKEICDLVNPQYGIITAIGSQHFETFKTIENVKNTKFELARGLVGAKKAVLNIDNKHISDVVSKKNKTKDDYEVISYSLKDKKAQYFATNIEYTKIGASFDVITSDGEKERMTIKLLGMHNIYNTLGAIAIAHKLGMTFKEIARGVSRVQPVEHRLQIIKSSDGNITVIDDTFNANPEGTSEALEVLKRMEGNQKIIITPGMIELGEKQYSLNLEFGEKCGKICDYTIMVGEIQTKPMQDAFEKLGISKDKYYVAKDLNDATRKLQTVLKVGDVVLYENDLPEDF